MTYAELLNLSELPYWVIINLGVAYFCYAKFLNDGKLILKSTDDVKKLLFSMLIYATLCLGLSFSIVLIQGTLTQTDLSIKDLVSTIMHICLVLFGISLLNRQKRIKKSHIKNIIFGIIALIIVITSLTLPYFIISLFYQFRELLFLDFLFFYLIILAIISVIYFLISQLILYDKRHKKIQLKNYFTKKDTIILTIVLLLIFLSTSLVFPNTSLLNKKTIKYDLDSDPKEAVQINKYEFSIDNHGHLGWIYINSKGLGDITQFSVVFNDSTNKICYNSKINSGANTYLDCYIKELIFHNNSIIIKYDDIRFKKLVRRVILRAEKPINEEALKGFKWGYEFRGCKKSNCTLLLNISNNLDAPIDRIDNKWIYFISYGNTINGMSHCDLTKITGTEEGIIGDNISLEKIDKTCNPKSERCHIDAISSLEINTKLKTGFELFDLEVPIKSDIRLELSLNCSKRE